VKSLSQKYRQAGVLARTAVVAGLMLSGFGLVVGGLASASVAAVRAVFPQAPAAVGTAEPDGAADPASPSPVDARSATRLGQGRSRTDAARTKGAPAKGDSSE
jgi:hypothetical protein